MHEIAALRGKVGHTTISTRGSVYDRYDHNPFKNRLNDALDLYKFYLDDTYHIYFKEGCQVLEKRFLQRLDTALTFPKIPGPQVDLNAKHQGQTWKGKTWRAILERLEALHSALVRAATDPSESDRHLKPLKRLNTVLVRPRALPPPTFYPLTFVISSLFLTHAKNFLSLYVDLTCSSKRFHSWRA